MNKNFTYNSSTEVSNEKHNVSYVMQFQLFLYALYIIKRFLWKYYFRLNWSHITKDNLQTLKQHNTLSGTYVIKFTFLFKLFEIIKITNDLLPVSLKLFKTNQQSNLPIICYLSLWICSQQTSNQVATYTVKLKINLSEGPQN